MKDRNIVTISCKQAFRKLKHRIGPYEYDMNIYRGCEHGCRYCYAYYSQRYLSHQDFTKDIYVKEHIADALARQLSSLRWTKQLINIGSVCDSYQPIEETYQIMRDILKVLITYQTPCIISTKSDLILRDLDLIRALSKVTLVNIASTITTMDEKKAAILEPHAVSPKRRAEMLKIIKQESDAFTGMHVMPMMPYLTDDNETFDHLLKTAKDINVDYAIFEPLNLRGETKQVYYQMLKEQYPSLYLPTRRLFQNHRIDRVYLKSVYERLCPMVKAYDINTDYMKHIRQHFRKQTIEQLQLF
ncbi:MAG: radical SAM protein [Erysipelotrichaceae bacterium]|nr:radical SAM protein [Erysipelotrichaceae bacterium]MCI9524340.1 radical SAM protein [Erysipelotrichaceae bacterium]